MAISEKDIKLLWGRAGGMCSKPGCNEDLTSIIETGTYLIGEMAHIIGKKPGAARGVAAGGTDAYENLILLCPNHHTHIDKAPEGTFPEKLLFQWKEIQENLIRSAGKTENFSSFCDLSQNIKRLLASNRAVFNACGPKSETALSNPSSNLFSVWELRRLDRILPNNRKILNLIDANYSLIPSGSIEIIEQFRVHAEAYERHVHQPLDSYPLFPKQFEEVFKGE